MKYLLDTCVISELIKFPSEEKVINWLSKIAEKNLYLSVLTIGEITKGIEKLPDSKRKSEIIAWLNHDLLYRFSDRILGVDFKIAKTGE